MADYPSSLYSASHVTDNVDQVQASDINTLQDEIAAIEAELGTDAAGSFSDVVTALLESCGEKFQTAGQIVYCDTTNSTDVLGIGTAGQVLTVNSGATAPEWRDNDWALNISLGDGSNAIDTDEPEQWLQLPKAGIIEGFKMAADTSGDLTVDVWKATFANFPPTDGGSITSSAQCELSSELTTANSTLTGWTTTFSAGDWLKFHVDTAGTLTQATLVLYGRWT